MQEVSEPRDGGYYMNGFENMRASMFGNIRRPCGGAMEAKTGLLS